MLRKGIPFWNAYFSCLSHFFWNDWVFEREYEFFVIQAEYYNSLSKFQPDAAIFPGQAVFSPGLIGRFGVERRQRQVGGPV